MAAPSRKKTTEVPDEVRSVIERLRRYRDRIAELMAMLRDRGRLIGAEAERARELFRALKDDLKAEVKAGSTNRGRAAMTATEKAYFYPAVQGAESQLMSRVSSAPDGRWFSELYAAEIDISYALRPLEKNFPMV
jgi:hypothetical protein